MALSDKRLDQLETKIIHALQKDARRPFKSIAKELDVSEGTIGNRVKRLVNKGILRLEARINPFALSNKVAALVGANLKERSHKETIKQIEALPNVNAVWATTGKYDIFIEVLVDSINELNNFIFESGLDQVKNVASTETHIMLFSNTKYFKI